MPQSHQELVTYLKNDGVLRSDAVVEAFRAIDRADFVPASERHAAYRDEALPIGHSQTISQPYTVAFMLELLSVKPSHTVADIGAGSGWQTALLASIVSQNEAQGHVYAFEIIPELCLRAKEHIARYNFIKRGIVSWQCRDAAILPEAVMFDRIIVAAAVSCKDDNILNCIPESWKHQLAHDGIIVVPAGGVIWRIMREGNDFRVEEFPGFAFVPYV